MITGGWRLLYLVPSVTLALAIVLVTLFALADLVTVVVRSLMLLWRDKDEDPAREGRVVKKIQGGPRCEHPEHTCGAALEPGDEEGWESFLRNEDQKWIKKMARRTASFGANR